MLPKACGGMPILHDHPGRIPIAGSAAGAPTVPPGDIKMHLRGRIQCVGACDSKVADLDVICLQGPGHEQGTERQRTTVLSWEPQLAHMSGKIP